MVERLFHAVPRVCLQFVIVVFPDHIHLLIFINMRSIQIQCRTKGVEEAVGALKMVIKNLFRALYDIASIYGNA